MILVCLVHPVHQDSVGGEKGMRSSWWFSLFGFLCVQYFDIICHYIILFQLLTSIKHSCQKLLKSNYAYTRVTAKMSGIFCMRRRQQRWQLKSPSLTYSRILSHFQQIHNGLNTSSAWWIMQTIGGENKLNRISAQKWALLARLKFKSRCVRNSEELAIPIVNNTGVTSGSQYHKLVTVQLSQAVLYAGVTLIYWAGRRG